MRRRTHFCSGDCEPYIIYDKIVYKAHTPVHSPTRRYIHESYMRAIGLMYAVRANKSDRNLTDQISGQSFDDHVEQFNSRSPSPPRRFYSCYFTRCRLRPSCHRFLSLSFSLSSAVLQSNLWSQLLTVAIVLILFDPRASTRGAKSPA